MLGLFDEDGNLNHVGVTAAFTMARRKELVAELEPYRMDSMEGHPWAAWGNATADSSRMPGSPSRWSGSRSMEWEALRPELVVEVAYDHMEGNRFRHATHFRRWRPDREPESCTYSQLEVPVTSFLEDIFGS